MNIDGFWLFGPGTSRILKISDQILFLGIHADDRAVGGSKVFLLSLDVVKLGISFRVSCAGLLLLDIDV